MNNLNKLTTISMAFVTIAFLTACGGGASSNGPGSDPNLLDLSQPEVALKVSSILLNNSPSGFLGGGVWTPKPYEGATRTDSDACGKVTLTNPDAVANAGDTIAREHASCSVDFGTTPAISYSWSEKALDTLVSLSNTAWPELVAWSAKEASKATGSANWSSKVTSASYSFVGVGDYSIDLSNEISHAADGSQTEKYRINNTSKGTENGQPYDYTVSGEGGCSYAISTKEETCTGIRFSLTGTIAGKSVNAVLTQPGPNVSKATPSYEITQNGQKILISFSPATLTFSITTANGTVLSARRANLLYIGGF